MQRFTFDINTIPKRLEIILLVKALAFPSTYLILSTEETSKPRLGYLKRTGHVLLAPLVDKEDLVFREGVLARIVSFREIENPSKKTFELEVLFRVKLINVHEAPGEFSAEWVMQPDKKIPISVVKDQEFKIKLELISYVFYDALRVILNHMEPLYIAELMEMLTKYRIVDELNMLSPETLGITLDTITGIINRIDADWDIFLPSVVILQETEVEKRLNFVIALLGRIASQEVFALKDSIIDTPISSRPAQNNPRDKKQNENTRWRRYNEIKNKISPDAQKEIEKIFERLEREGKSQESSMSLTHLDNLLQLFSLEETIDNTNLVEAKRILEEDHWGLEKPKERILGYLAVRKHAAEGNVNILCLVGPPGVGKTSLGQSIARALGRKFTHFSLGGLRDAEAIKGYELVYISTHPGQIIKGILRAGSKNPVFMLDEVDKMGDGWRGDPASAFLEVLDPEQNKEFFDKNINVSFDLSKVFFICTANTISTIPSPLLDRMEVIKLSGYTVYEKLSIAKIHLVPKERRKFGIPLRRGEPSIPLNISLSDNAIIKLIEEYTYESGVRNLERAIANIYRKVVMDFELGEIKDTDEIKITVDNLHLFAGKPHVYPENRFEKLPPGCVPMFAVSESGGHFFYVEVMMRRGWKKREIKVTGIRGSEIPKGVSNLIEESIHIALDSILLEGGILDDWQKENKGDYFIHVHVGDMDIPKDGPSAGVPLLWALLGLLISEPIQPNLGATGTIDLRLGRLGVVGGIREKSIAARRAGIKRFIISKENERDLDEVPWEIKEETQFVMKRFWWETLEEAFPQNPLIKKYIEKRQSSI